MYKGHAYPVKPPYALDDILAFESYHELTIPPLLRNYLLQISRETCFRFHSPFTIDLSVELNGPKITKNSLITEAMIHERWCSYSAIIEQVELAPYECSFRDIEDGTIKIAERALAIVKGNGYGMVLIEGPDEYELKSLEDLLGSKDMLQ